MNSHLRIIVTGLIAQHPTLGGVAWDYLQYVLALSKMGHDVYYIEDSGQWPYNTDGGPEGNNWVARDPRPNLQHLDALMRRYGLGDRWAYHFPIESRWYGLSDRARQHVVQTADLLINVSGTLEFPERYRGGARLAYIDSDPVFTQAKLCMEEDGAFAQRVAAHDVWFSFGEQFSAAVPATGYNWLPTRSPVVLDEWHPGGESREVITTVMSWTSYEPLVYGGQEYAQKDVEFRRFLPLAAAVHPTLLEVALNSTEHVNWRGTSDDASTDFNERSPGEVLTSMGWQVVDPDVCCATPDSYRSYIESSRAEWSVAKHGYVVGQSGWFSCRSACYLAAARPVVVQETGFSSVLPTGEGIVGFRTLEEAVEGIADVQANYGRHSQAARDIAATCFDGERVLGRLVEQAMATDAGS